MMMCEYWTIVNAVAAVSCWRGGTKSRVLSDPLPATFMALPFGDNVFTKFFTPKEYQVQHSNTDCVEHDCVHNEFKSLRSVIGRLVGNCQGGEHHSMYWECFYADIHFTEAPPRTIEPLRLRVRNQLFTMLSLGCWLCWQTYASTFSELTDQKRCALFVVESSQKAEHYASTIRYLTDLGLNDLTAHNASLDENSIGTIGRTQVTEFPSWYFTHAYAPCLSGASFHFERCTQIVPKDSLIDFLLRSY